MTESRDIAIVGMSCSFPGSPNMREYWRVIRDGRASFRPVPRERWDHSRFHSTNPRDTDTTYASRIAHLDDIRSFAPEEFRMPPRRVRTMDPQQRLVLDHVRLAAHDAGYGARSLPRSTGVYIGASVADYKDLVVSRLRARQILGGDYGAMPPVPPETVKAAVKDVGGIQQYSMLGVLLNMIACNVNEVYDFSGPALVMDAACSSALVATHEAMLHLRAGICDSAIVGGVYTICTPDLMVGFSRIGALSRSDVCRPFDAGADGFVLGEGVGVVILKRFDDAVRDGDRIHAVIKGAGLNNDGRGDGPMTPRQSGQVEALSRAYRDANVSPHTISYVEAHGTATPVGDATEIGALKTNAAAGSDGRIDCAVASVKGNIGHPLAAAGMAGLIKSVLVLQNGLIPPQAGWRASREALGLEDSGFYVPSAAVPFERRNGPRRVGVNAFGFGGTNVHVIVEEAPPQPQRRVMVAVPEAQEPQLVVVSASAPARLAEYLDTLAGEVSEAHALRDIAYSLTAARPHESSLVAFVAANLDDLRTRLADAATVVRGGAADAPAAGIFYSAKRRKARNVAFLFPGEVARRSEICTDAYQRFTSLREELEELAGSLDGEIQRPLSSLFESSREAFAHDGSQPGLALMQLGLARLLARLGVNAVATLGQGFGTLVAAAVGGAVKPADALHVVAQRRAVPLVSSFQRLETSAARIPVISCSASAPYPEDESARVRALCRDTSARFDLGDGLRGLRDVGADVLVQICGAPATAPDGTTPDIVTLAPFLHGLAHLAALGVPLDLEPLYEGAERVVLPQPPLARRPFWIIDPKARTTDVEAGASDEPEIETAPAPIAAPAKEIIPGPVAPAFAPLRSGASDDDIRARVLETVAKVSSFPMDTLQPTQQLGDDLSFDSLMMYELYAGLGDSFPDAGGLSQSLLRRDTTIEELAEAVVAACRQGVTRAEPKSEGIARYVVQTVDRPLLHQPEAELPFARAVIIDDGSGVAPLLQRALPDAIVVTTLDAVAASDAVIDLSALHCDDAIDAARLRAPVLALLARASSLAANRPAMLVVAHGGRSSLGIAGAAKALAKEWPETIVRAIEVPAAAKAEAIAALLLAELRAGDPTVEVSYASGTRQVLAPKRASVERRDLPDHAVAAISGGARGLGAKLAIELARRHRARLLLLGRASDATETIAAIRDAGGDALYVSCDVRVASEVAGAFAEARKVFGPITHVVHTAGIVADEPVAAKTADRATAVLDTKISGCLALWEAARPDPLEAFLSFGSLAGRFGNAHQFDYSAANHVLGRLPSILGAERTDVRIATIDLPPWEGSGMISSLPDAVRRAMRDRVRFLSDGEGLDFVIDELAADEASREVVLGVSLDEEPRLDRAAIALGTANDPWLEDHRIAGEIVVPFAWLADQAAAAALRAGLGPRVALSAFEISGMFTAPARLSITAAATNGQADIRIEAEAPRKATLRVRATNTVEALPQLELPDDGFAPALPLADFYEHHLFHGPRLRALTSIVEIGPSHGIAATSGASDPRLHGATLDILALDSMLQLCAYWASVQIGRIGLPLGADEIRILERTEPGAELRIAGIVRQSDGELLVSDLDLLRLDGAPVLQLRGLRCKLLEAATFSIREQEDNRNAEWRVEDFPEVKALRQRLAMARMAGMRNPYFSVHERVTNSTSVIAGREVVNFASYNYLGLSGDPEVNAAAAEAVERYGTSVSASRLASGEKPLHRDLEREVAEFLGCEDSIVMVGGHATNVSVIGHLFGPQDLIVHDSLAHDSILGGIKLSGAKRRPFPHNDCDALDAILRQARRNFRRVLIAVEGVYSMDGDMAPLDRIVEIKKRHQAMLLVDEAHSLGVLGATGRGIGETFNVTRADVELWMGTLSKSLASCGGYIAGSAELVQFLKYSTPGFIYSVGISPANAAAALAALRKIRAHPELVATLHERSALFLQLCRERGVDTGFSNGTAIIPCIVGSSIDCLRLSEAMAGRLINVQPILYPAVEEHLTRLRFFVTAHHSERQLRKSADVLAEELAKIRGTTGAVESPALAHPQREVSDAALPQA